MQSVEWIDLPTFGDIRGCLTVAEAETVIPFKVRRMFWIYNVPPTAARASHGHKVCKQVLVAVNGYLTANVGGEYYRLDSTCKGLFIPPGNFIELFGFGPGTVLLVFASEYYDENDYYITGEI